MNSRKVLAVVIPVVVLLVDQLSKFWVKMNMQLNETIPVFGDWARLHFTENPGMAYGIEAGGYAGKYALTSFRIFAILFIIYYINKLIKAEASRGFVATMSLILAGAIGNVIDSLLYGYIFNSGKTLDLASGRYIGYPGVSELDFSGYAGFMQGCVVDMLYFPIFRWPEWMPLLGGEMFFNAIFNVADAAISIGVFLIIIFNKRFFKQLK